MPNLGWNFHPSRDYGDDWRSYFAEYTSQLRDFKAGDRGPEHRVLVAPRPAMDDDPMPPQAEALIKLLDRPHLAKYSVTWEEGAVFKSGPREGDYRPDKTILHYAIGTGDVDFPVVTAVWSENKLVEGKYLHGPDEEIRTTASIQELTRWVKGVFDE